MSRWSMRSASCHVVQQHIIHDMNHCGREIFKTCVNQLWVLPSFLCIDTGPFPAAKKPGHTTHLIPRLKNKQVYTSSPLCLHGMLQNGPYLLQKLEKESVYHLQCEQVNVMQFNDNRHNEAWSKHAEVLKTGFKNIPVDGLMVVDKSMLQLYVIQYSHFQVLYLNFGSLSLSLHFFDRQNYNAQRA